jgi:acetolactate synthase-1/3 small subunit
VSELDDLASVERELALFKLAPDGRRTEVLEVVEIFRAKVVDLDPDSIVVEATGTSHKIAALEQALRPYRIVEMARTGRVALNRGPRGLKAPGPRPIPVAYAMARHQEGAAL